MKLQAHARPDGAFDVAGSSYRLEQAGEHFAVIRTEDGQSVGGFRLNALPGRRRAAVIDGDADEPKVVSAIAELVSQPRGVLPIQ